MPADKTCTLFWKDGRKKKRFFQSGGCTAGTKPNLPLTHLPFCV